MRQIVTKGIVLSRTNFGEADRILTIITPGYGRIRAIAKGVRKVKSKLAGGIELFSVSHITFIKGKGEIDTLISTRLDRHFGNIVSNLERTMFGYNILKLFNRIVEDNSGEEYFTLLEHTLDGLNKLELNLQLVELWLNLQLLKTMGHSPNLLTDGSGAKLTQSGKYNFDPDAMQFIGGDNGNFDSSHIKLLRLGLKVDSPSTLGQIKQVDKILPACVQLSNAMLKQFVRA